MEWEVLKTLEVEPIVFEPEFRSMDAVRGLEEFSHIWLLWEFSKAKREHVSLTVTPPRLGGKVKKGVFATRAPYRPNSIGLSSVKLEEIYWDEARGPVLVESGADLHGYDGEIQFLQLEIKGEQVSDSRLFTRTEEERCFLPRNTV